MVLYCIIARDYVEGMWRILQQDEPEDFVLATGETHTVREFVEKAFAELDIKVKCVIIHPLFFISIHSFIHSFIICALILFSYVRTDGAARASKKKGITPKRALRSSRWTNNTSVQPKSSTLSSSIEILFSSALSQTRY